MVQSPGRVIGCEGLRGGRVQEARLGPWADVRRLIAFCTSRHGPNSEFNSRSGRRGEIAFCARVWPAISPARRHWACI